jgi:hypothetical protein
MYQDADKGSHCGCRHDKRLRTSADVAYTVIGLKTLQDTQKCISESRLVFILLVFTPSSTVRRHFISPYTSLGCVLWRGVTPICGFQYSP